VDERRAHRVNIAAPVASRLRYDSTDAAHGPVSVVMRVPWHGALAALIAVRIAIPLAALAASGHRLPGQPRYDFVPLTGDATGFYAAAREFLAAWERLPAALVAALALLVLAGAASVAVLWRRRAELRPWLVAASVAGFGLVVTAAVTQMNESGAAVFGWPLVWSLPMLPYRALGFPLDPEIAFAFGLPLSLAANAVTVVATAYVGLYATGRRAVGLAAAALYALWPLLTGTLVGERAWENGTWTVDVGLVLYTEPLSTALTTVALALLLSPRATDLRLAVAGVALSLGTLVKLSNGLLAAAALVLLLVWRRRPWPFTAGAASLVPVVAAYWPLGYQAGEDDTLLPPDPFAVSYVDDSWLDSLLFRPRLLVLLVPLVALGAAAIGRRPRLMLVSWIVIPAVFYSFYRVTFEHPRFLFGTLPAAFALWAAGAFALSRALAR
jgi:hypothetical protein